MKKIVLDAWPLLSFFQNEATAGEVEGILKESQHNDDQLLICTINAGEIWYSVSRVHGEKEADRTLEEIRQLNIVFIPADWQLARSAAVFKSAGGLSYADCFAAALARERDGSLVTGDPEFRSLEGDLDIIWI